LESNKKKKFWKFFFGNFLVQTPKSKKALYTAHFLCLFSALEKYFPKNNVASRGGIGPESPI
jgi:hypothetical protein